MVRKGKEREEGDKTTDRAPLTTGAFPEDEAGAEGGGAREGCWCSMELQ